MAGVGEKAGEGETAGEGERCWAREKERLRERREHQKAREKREIQQAREGAAGGRGPKAESVGLEAMGKEPAKERNVLVVHPAFTRGVGVVDISGVSMTGFLGRSY